MRTSLLNSLPKKIAIWLVALCLSVPASAEVFTVQLDESLFGHLNQADVTGCPPAVACGPTAAANSFGWLQQRYPTVYGMRLVPDINTSGTLDSPDLAAVANTLSGPNLMNCSECSGGTFIDEFIYGKTAYIEQVAPGRTQYAAQDPFAWDVTRGGVAQPRPGYIQPVNPTFGFLFNELLAGEDVEILINGDFNHYLTLTSLEWDDVLLSGTMDYIDPATGAHGVSNISQVGNFINTDYGGGSSNIVAAVSESPVPEPATILLLGSMLLGFGIVLRRRRSDA
jgi:hypothetical protein